MSSTTRENALEQASPFAITDMWDQGAGAGRQILCQDGIIANFGRCARNQVHVHLNDIPVEARCYLALTVPEKLNITMTSASRTVESPPFHL